MNSHRIDAFASPHGGPIGTIVEDRGAATVRHEAAVMTHRHPVGVEALQPVAVRRLLRFQQRDGGELELQRARTDPNRP